MRIARWLGVLALVAAAIVGWWYANARADPIVRRVTVPLADWPAGARPVTVALISDIHLGNATMDVLRLRRIVAQVNAARPDLVAIAGDMVAGHDPAVARQAARDLVAPLRGLHAPLGVVATLGNHDQSVPRAITAGLEQAGVTVINNRAVRRGPLRVIGVGDAFTHHDLVAAAMASAAGLGGASVVVTHSPDASTKLPSGVDLVLAGHTHCGQVLLPLVGPPKRYWLNEFLCGVVRHGARTTIISAGLGTSELPLRWRAPPDLWLVSVGPAGRVSRSRP